MVGPAHILLVEDNKMDVELTLDAFDETQLESSVAVARDGQAALNYVFAQGEYLDRKAHPMPDLVLLDLKMPKVDGFEVLRRMKSTPVVRRIPVIVLTSSHDEGDRMTSYDNGANSYLVKPVSFEGFLKVVKQVGEYWLRLNVAPPAITPPCCRRGSAPRRR